MIPALKFGLTAHFVKLEDDGNVRLKVQPDSREELEKYRFKFLATREGENTDIFGGPTREFGRSFLGSSFKKAETPDEVVLANQFIADLKVTPDALKGTGLTETGVKHRLLKGLALTLCADAVAFRERFARMLAEGRDKVTL